MTQNKKRRNRKGFTLIELIVVIAILAILAAIAIPAFMGQLRNARIKSHIANVAVLRSAAQVALAENVPAGFIWGGTGLVWDDTVGTDVYDPDKYLDTWPVNPMVEGDSYVVTVTVDANGNASVEVDPAANAYS